MPPPPLQRPKGSQFQLTLKIFFSAQHFLRGRKSTTLAMMLRGKEGGGMEMDPAIPLEILSHMHWGGKDLSRKVSGTPLGSAMGGGS